MPAIESSHALAGAVKEIPKMGKDEIAVMMAMGTRCTFL